MNSYNIAGAPASGWQPPTGGRRSKDVTEMYLYSLMQYSGMIFDFNGVLLWDSPLHEQVWRDFAETLRGAPLNDDEFRQHVHGWPNGDILEYIIGKPLSPNEAYRLSQEKETIYRQICLTWEGFRLSPGAIDLLDFLAAHNIPRTIATASEQTNVTFFIEQLQLAHWFDIEKIVLDDGHFPGKPAPDIYLKAAGQIGLPPAECVVVEDSVAGLQAAHRAGIGRIYALGPPEKRIQLKQLAGVYAVISQLSEIPFTIFR